MNNKNIYRVLYVVIPKTSKEKNCPTAMDSPLKFEANSMFCDSGSNFSELTKDVERRMVQYIASQSLKRREKTF